MLIEDDEATLYALAHRLSYRGYLPLSTTGGYEALDLLGQHLPDAIVLDWRLPGLDGAEVLRRIRSDARLAKVPVLIYSAYIDDGMNRQAVACGATACVAKGTPSDDALLTTLARYVPVRA